VLPCEAQHRLDGFFCTLSRETPLHARPELRVRLAPRRYRVVDLAVYANQKPAEDVPSSPPLFALEILSREDRFMQVREKLEEYRLWGVSHIWLVDPWVRKFYVYTGAGLSEVPAFQIPEFQVEIPPSQIFG